MMKFGGVFSLVFVFNTNVKEFVCSSVLKSFFMQAYVKMYQGDELPEPKSMLQARQSFSSIVNIIVIIFVIPPVVKIPGVKNKS